MAGQQHFANVNTATFLNLSFNSSGDNTIISGVAGQQIRLVKLALGVASGSSVTATLWDGPSNTGTAKGTFILGAVIEDLESNPIVLTAGNAFVINLSSGVTVKGQVAYVQE